MSRPTAFKHNAGTDPFARDAAALGDHRGRCAIPEVPYRGHVARLSAR